MRYQIIETVTYEIEADDEDAALNQFVDHDNRDELFVECTFRTVEATE